MVDVEALIFRNDIREVSPLQIHDDNFAHLGGKGYYHEETTDDCSIIIFGESEPYGFEDITSTIKDSKTLELIDEFVKKRCFEMEQVFVAINENCSNNILFCYDYDIDFSEYFEDEYSEYYDEKKNKITGYVFLEQDDADLFEAVQEVQEKFAKENGLDVNFVGNSEYEEKIKELEQKVIDYIEDNL